MYIEITVFKGDNPFTPIYEKANANDIVSAQGELERVARHVAKDIMDGKVEVCDECHNIIERRPVFYEDETGEHDYEGEYGHEADCPKANALV